MANLSREGICRGVIKVGDVMLDAYLHHQALAMKKATILTELDLQPGRYYLAAVHRQENTEDQETLGSIFAAFREIANPEYSLVVPLHPRTKKTMAKLDRDVWSDSQVRVIPPVSYLDMVALESEARLIFTDSGGVQKEAFFAGVPCVTLRQETKWVETVEI